MGDNAQLGAKERAQAHDELEASVLSHAPSTDETFRAQARQLADIAALGERQRTAETIASHYVPYKSRNGARDTIVRLLLAAAEPPRAAWWSEPQRIPPALIRLQLDMEQARALGMAAVWVDASPDELDAHRRRNRMDVLKEGAELVALRGAGRCFECGHLLGMATRRTRTDYCRRHHVPEPRRRSRENAIREILDAASGHRRIRRSQKRRHHPHLPADPHRGTPSPKEGDAPWVPQYALRARTFRPCNAKARGEVDLEPSDARSARR